jgi:hypothetical protein
MTIRNRVRRLEDAAKAGAGGRKLTPAQWLAQETGQRIDGCDCTNLKELMECDGCPYDGLEAGGET